MSFLDDKANIRVLKDTDIGFMGIDFIDIHARNRYYFVKNFQTLPRI